MGRRFAELAFTPLVKEQQLRHGSRHQYERIEKSDNPGNVNRRVLILGERRAACRIAVLNGSHATALRERGLKERSDASL